MTVSKFSEDQNTPPVFLFGAVGLQKNSGGIAELSRQVFRTLVQMHHAKTIQLNVAILEEAGPELDDELFQDFSFSNISWYQGNRIKFALSLLFSKAQIQLFDHVGIARLPGLLPKLLRRPYILLVHGVEIWKNDRKDYRRTAQKATLLIANSNYTVNKIRNHYPELTKIEVCWPGKDKSKFHKSTKQNAIHNIGKQAMLIVGRLASAQKHKGHDNLIEAMPLILESVPDAQLIITGKGDDNKRLVEKVENLNLRESIIFTGWVDEAQLAQLYKQCALFVLPSEGDGFGMVFLEAMMHKLPCVGLRSGAAQEIFQHNVTGVLVDRDNLNQLSEILSNLLSDEIQLKSIGNAGYQEYINKFQSCNFILRLQKIINSHMVDLVNQNSLS